MSGIFGVVAKKNCMDDLFYVGDYHSHLGSSFAGIAVSGKEITRRIHNITNSQFKSKLFEDFKSVQGSMGIGSIGYEEQPIYVKSKFGDFCLVVNGWIDNWKDLADELMAKGNTFSEVADHRVNICELVSKLINQKDSIQEGINYMFSRIDGSICLVMLTSKGIYAARDKQGVFPLVLGKKDGSWAVVTETAAFPNTQFEVVKYLMPGELIFIDKNGVKEQAAASKRMKVCSFLWIYTGFPASNYEGINVEVVRERSGRFLAKGDDIKPDFSCGVPDSGTAHALGYAMEKKIPYRRALVKYTPGYGRSYLPPTQGLRDLVARMKLIPIKEIIQGAKIVLCEDSIVRGTQLKNYTMQKFWDNGAKEVHVRPACPPLMFPCKYNFSTRTLEELVARRAIQALEKNKDADITPYIDDKSERYKAMVSWIAKDLCVTSLKYQRLDDMIAAIGVPKEKLCLYCWTGK